MFASIVTYAALRVHWLGGPGSLVIILFLLAFGPSLIYALIEDDSSNALFFISTLIAIGVVLFLWAKLPMYRQKK